jgi:GNAT superfamily N-acetyltransferase
VSEYSFGIEENASPEDVKTVWDGLADYNLGFIGRGVYEYHQLRIFLRDADGRLAGGMLGESFWGWLHIDIFWLEEAARRQGLGAKLLAMAEDEGRRRGCKYAYLDTLSFQARPFYEKQGYEVFAEQADYPLGHTRWFLKKTL